MFITFEGIDGCGKSTQVKLLSEQLDRSSIPNVVTREPGGTVIGQQIRSLLLDSRNQVLAPMAELLLFAADRAQHLSELIFPALAQGKFVICDRFIDSTFAYQVGGRGLEENLISQVVDIATGGKRPDKTFLFDISPEIALARASKIKSADRFERESIAFYQRIRTKYLELSQKEQERFVVIDSENNSIEKIHKIILDSLRINLGTI